MSFSLKPAPVRGHLCKAERLVKEELMSSGHRVLLWDLLIPQGHSVTLFWAVWFGLKFKIFLQLFYVLTNQSASLLLYPLPAIAKGLYWFTVCIHIVAKSTWYSHAWGSVCNAQIKMKSVGKMEALILPCWKLCFPWMGVRGEGDQSSIWSKNQNGLLL